MVICICKFNDSVNSEEPFNFYSMLKNNHKEALIDFVLIPESDDILQKYLKKEYAI